MRANNLSSATIDGTAGQEPSVMQAEPASSSCLVEIRNVSLSYGTSPKALADISFRIGNGEFISLIGPSGCGKTSLLNLLVGLVARRPEGDIRIAGEAPQLGSPHTAYMLARDCLLPWRTALDNVCLGMEIRRVPIKERIERGQAMLAAVGLSNFDDHYPKQLSHGMRQRVALARTFALDSKLLLMDEPFGALDAQTKLQLEDLLLGLCQKFQRTVVFVTHDLGEAIALSDRVVVMSSRPGQIIAEVDVDLPRPRSIRELQKSPHYHELYAQLWTLLESGWTRHEG